MLGKLSKLIVEVRREAEPEAIHQLRNTLLRVETLFPEDPRVGQSKLILRLKKLRRKAGKVRDLDILEGLAKDLRMGPRAERARLQSFLRKDRRKRKNKLVKYLQSTSVKRLSADLRAKRKELNAESAEDQLLREVLDRFAVLGEEQDYKSRKTLHTFRTGCKRLRYIAERTDHPQTQAAVRQLRRIQDAVGAWHDVVNLIERSRELFGNAARNELLIHMREKEEALFKAALAKAEQASSILLSMRWALVERKPPKSVAVAVVRAGEKARWAAR